MSDRTEAESNQFIGWYDGFHGRDVEVADLQADNKRLRAALEKIAHLTPMILTGADSPAAHLAQRMGVIATDALEQKVSKP
jgi:hypothetical protein